MSWHDINMWVCWGGGSACGYACTALLLSSCHLACVTLTCVGLCLLFECRPCLACLPPLTLTPL